MLNVLFPYYSNYLYEANNGHMVRSNLEVEYHESWTADTYTPAKSRYETATKEVRNYQNLYISTDRKYETLIAEESYNETAAAEYQESLY